MGRSTVYRKLEQWGYSVENRLLTQQASVLAGIPQRERAIICSPDMVRH